MQTMKARYSGTCCRTGERIVPGDTIRMHGRGRTELIQRTGGTSVDVVRIGHNKYFRNMRGRCIDAPCCGCCTI